MNLQDQVIYRCIHPACAKSLAHKVKFCPYCGTGQMEVQSRAQPQAVQVAAAPAPVMAEAAPQPAPPPAPPRPDHVPDWRNSPALLMPEMAPAPTVTVAKQAPAHAAAAPPVSSAPPVSTAPPVSAPARPAAPQVAKGPPLREPIRLRYWLITLAILGAIWYYAKPNPKKIENRVERAMAMAAECNPGDAQMELVKLQLEKAAPEQVKRLQAAMAKSATACERKLPRAKALRETKEAIESALTDGEPARAQARLALFVKRWGDDAESLSLKSKIASATAAKREKEAAAPKPATARPTASQAQSARNLISEAERELAIGNYKAASDKLETCIAMVEGSTECAAYKLHAERLLKDQQLCLAARRDWVGDRCQ